MGQRASDTRGITFEDVVVPSEVGIHRGYSQGLALTFCLNVNTVVRVY